MKEGLDEAVGLWVIEEAVGLLLEDFAFCEFARCCKGEQFAVGRLAPEQEAQARSEFARGYCSR